MDSKQATNFHLFIGIDMSKKKFDVCVLDLQGQKKGSKTFQNNTAGFTLFIDWVSTHYQKGEMLFCMEHTGVYSRLLGMYIQDENLSLCMESGYVIKRSGGMVKGKTDKIDAFRIADFALSNKHRLRIAEKYDIELIELHDLMSTRRRLIETLKVLQAAVNEAKEYAGKDCYELLKVVNEDAIQGVKQLLKKVDEKIDERVASNESHATNLALATSVKGIGRVMGIWMLIYTRNFSQEMNARKFASLVGIAPFEIESGTSVRGGSHVSNHAHRYLKGILHTCVMSAIRNSPRIKAYHEKKKQEGKKGFVVMNNIKNKLIQTVFAVVRSQNPCEDTFIHKLAS